jgi:hypothetical protein
MVLGGAFTLKPRPALKRAFRSSFAAINGRSSTNALLKREAKSAFCAATFVFDSNEQKAI